MTRALIESPDCWKPTRLGHAVPNQSRIAKHIAEKYTPGRGGWSRSNLEDALTELRRSTPKDCNGDPDWKLSEKETQARAKWARSLWSRDT
jgi:hypothetical protein